MYVRESCAEVSPEDYAIGTNAALAITYAAPGRGHRHRLSGVAVSFDVSPGIVVTLDILDGTATVFSLDLGHDQAVIVYFDPPKCFSTNTALTINLANAGVGVTSKLNALGHWVDTS